MPIQHPIKNAIGLVSILRSIADIISENACFALTLCFFNTKKRIIRTISKSSKHIGSAYMPYMNGMIAKHVGQSYISKNPNQNPIANAMHVNTNRVIVGTFFIITPSSSILNILRKHG